MIDYENLLGISDKVEPIIQKKKSNGKGYKSCNELPPSLQQFFKKARLINQNGNPFSLVDFPNLKPGYFRQIILRLGPLVERIGKGNPQLYKIQGIDLPGSSHLVTPKGMMDTKIVEDLLQNLEHQPAKIHDIKIKFESDLHANLVKKGCSVNTSNNCIVVSYHYPNNNITTKIQVYPQTTVVDIGCTYKPIIYDSSGLFFLLQHLAELRAYLLHLSNLKATIPNVHMWIFTHYHFGKDGTQELNGQSFHITVENFANGLLRYYSKVLNGQKVARLEQVRTPNRTLAQELEVILNK